MFFPGCIYSQHPEQWVIAFWNLDNDQLIKVPSAAGQNHVQ